MMSPLSKKLLFKGETCWLLLNAPDNYLRILEPLPEGTVVKYEASGDFDGIQLFVKNTGELAGGLKLIMPLLKPETIFWVIYPKKISGITSDLEMTGSWDEPGKYGLRVVTAAAIDQTWTALRFRFKELTKTSESCNSEIPTNEYGDYIDIDNKQVRLPGYMRQEMEKSSVALDFYDTLSYSNKKEYVVWILSAKQEKTRSERLSKLVEKLLNRKKNPSEK